MAIKYPNVYHIYDDYATITISGGKYEGTVITFDLDDLEKVQKYHWGASRYGYKKKRIYISNGKNKMLLQRYIMNNTSKDETDHIDGDTLNNRKSNLRIISRAKNAMNRRLNEDNKSGHKGVCLDEFWATPKWKAYIQVNKKFINLGHFDTLEEAVEVRLKAEEKYFGEYKRQEEHLRA